MKKQMICDNLTTEDFAIINDLKRTIRKKHIFEEYKRENNVWQGKDGRFYTYIKEDGKRKLVAKKTKEKMIDFVFETYISTEPTLDIIFYEWIQEKEDDSLKNASLSKYENTYKRYFSTFGKKKISEIDEDILTDFIKKSIKSFELTRKTYADFRIILRGILKYARKNDLTNISPAVFFDEIDLPKTLFQQKAKNVNDEVFSADEVELLKKYLLNNLDVKNILIYACMLTGLRIGEITALQISDIKNGYFFIHATEVKFKDKNGHWTYNIQDSTKTINGTRKVFFPKALEPLLKKCITMSNTKSFLAWTNGKRICSSTLRHRYSDILKKLNIYGKTFHSLRKTYASTLYYSGVEDSFLTEMLGHSDISTTRKYYIGFQKNDSEKEDIINSIFKK